MKVDARKTWQFAEKIKKEIENVTSANVEIKQNKSSSEDAGVVNFVVNGGVLVPNSEQVGATAKNIDKAIDSYFRNFRQRGWIFSQRVGAEFSIAIPSEINECNSFRDFLRK